jgi:hypothetical protein
VARLDELLVAAHGDALGIGQGLLELGGEFVEAHDFLPENGVLGVNGADAGVFKLPQSAHHSSAGS